MTAPNLPKGKYQHFKGQYYQVLHIARHSETDNYLVIYQKLYDDYSIWARPYEMFVEEIEREGKRIKRFSYIGVE